RLQRFDVARAIKRMRLRGEDESDGVGETGVAELLPEDGAPFLWRKLGDEMHEFRTPCGGGLFLIERFDMLEQLSRRFELRCACHLRCKKLLARHAERG